MSNPRPLARGNSRVKEARKLISRRSERSERRLFLADGPKAVEGALGAGVVVELFATPAAAEQYADVVAAFPVTLVDDSAMESLSDSVSPAGVVAVCRFLDDEPVLDPRTAPLIAICADVRDPGNAGTVIRCADAAGASGVVLAGNSVDPYNPKAVRASVGSLFHLPIGQERDAATAVQRARTAGYTVLAADGGGDVDLYDADELLARPTAWLFGNEAWGLPPELRALADHVVSIPIFGRAESLNLSTAAALCLYASARVQRG
ncbi:TrmH family RNA methyltransferase [Nocardioides mangrovi]|uniref:RNA methyltransferase n=1 Tax=Nocardioides mangrovi TaxID=2874580 RepID=A0ABS7UKF4_9ACTN|nr:RNA methyltransferase [Nocardioides mangrovi]MBZ5741118.1 RNA methyltransferase [Nocardioides mangrovi]